MALADWTITGNGSYSIVNDPTSPGTNPNVLRVIGSELAFFNITVGALQNSRIETFTRMVGATSAVSLRLRLRNQGTGIIGTGATADCYFLNFRKIATGSSTTDFDMGIFKNVTSIIPLTGLVMITVPNNLDWQKVRFSAFTTGGNTYLRGEWWDGAAYQVICECSDNDATLNGASGTEGFQFSGFSSLTEGYADDTNLYSLT
jgi:hypothetical protein